MIPRVLLSWRKRLGTVHGARDHKAGSKLARHAADILPSHAGKAGYEAPPECEKGAAASAVQWRPWIVRCAAGLLALVVVRFLLVANEAWVDSLELRNFSPLDALPAVAWEAGRRVPLGLVALGLSTRLFQSVLCILSLPEFFPSPHPPEPQAWVDSLELWNFFPLQSLPAVAWEEAPPRPGCIVTLDSRYSPEGVAAVEAAVARLLRELGVEAEEVKEDGGGRGREAMPEAWRRFYSGLPKVVDAEGHENMWKFPIWVALAVNMCVCAAALYARRHGYRMVVENGSKYTPDRHPSWFKVPLLQSQLACCCEWAFFLDSDAYMRMDHHRLSIPTWIQTIKQPNYFDWLLRDNLTDTLEGQVWLPQDPALLLQPATALQPEGPVVLIPRNGDSREGFFGDAEALFRKDTDYVNAGVMLWRRSPATFKFLRQWYGEYSGDYHLYGHVWEQDRLNKVARWPHWRGRVILVPHQELTGPQGAMVRHVWGGVASEERDRVLYAALEEALGPWRRHWAACSEDTAQWRAVRGSKGQ
ncbi:unnamed protein product [Closterium sp. Naga37s-1]|nr:unnamed protein product [Closterium sp. Naga37s-1]